jgi:cell division septation protein DedD
MNPFGWTVRFMAQLPKSRLFSVVIASTSLVGFGFVVWYAYQQGVRVGSEEMAPLLRAEASPIKLKPENPGGMEVLNQDKLVFDRLTPDLKEPLIERLLPPPETPLPRPETRAVAGPSAAPAEAGKKTGEKAGGGPLKLAALPDPPEKTTIEKAEKVEKDEKSEKGEKSAPPSNVGPSPKPAKARAPAAEGRYRIQIAALRSKAAVRREWERLLRVHGELLKTYRLYVERVDLGARGVFFRLRVGPLPREQAARRLCAALTARKVPCVVVKLK